MPRANGEIIFKGKLIQVTADSDSIRDKSIYGVFRRNQPLDNRIFGDIEEMNTYLTTLRDICDSSEEYRELEKAQLAVSEYWLYGSVGGHADYDDPDIRYPDEASLRLENFVEKRPRCYGDHKEDDRKSRCLICEHETECLAATKRINGNAKANSKPKKINPKSTENRKENKFMKQMENLFRDFYPSEVPSGEVAMTMSGQIAVGRKDGSYVRYDAASGQIENQMNLVISSKKLDKMYLLMPTPINALAAGDVIKEKETYYQIIEVKAAEARIKAANLSTGTESNIKIENNIFTGQKMYRKVFSFFNMAQQNGNQAMAGMMNPMALMMMDSMGESSGDAMKMMAMMSMMNPQAGQGMMNPMMMYFMMGDSEGSDDSDGWIKMMAMSSMMQQFSGNNGFGFPMMQQTAPKMTNPYAEQQGCNFGEEVGCSGEACNCNGEPKPEE